MAHLFCWVFSAKLSPPIFLGCSKSQGTDRIGNLLTFHKILLLSYLVAMLTHLGYYREKQQKEAKRNSHLQRFLQSFLNMCCTKYTENIHKK